VPAGGRRQRPGRLSNDQDQEKDSKKKEQEFEEFPGEDL